MLHKMKFSDVDEMLGTPARLAILATVARPPAGEDRNRWTFMALRRETSLADGNLHVQTRKLVEAGYLARESSRQGGRTVTRFELTAAGRDALQTLIARLRAAVETPPKPPKPGVPKPSRAAEKAPKPARPRRREPVDDSRVW